jgi:4-amino-4-deoxy-L-arabinose transferase-like glycosyltransferase
MVTIPDIQYVIVLLLTVLVFGLEVFALVDAARTRADAFTAAGKQTKTRWLIILGLATAIGFLTLPFGGGGVLSLFGILPIIGVVAAAVYVTDVRPAVRQIRGGGGRQAGPYGPW